MHGPVSRADISFGGRGNRLVDGSDCDPDRPEIYGRSDISPHAGVMSTGGMAGLSAGRPVSGKTHQFVSHSPGEFIPLD